MTKTLHAHVSRSSSDCDGPQHDTFVVGFNDDERAESKKEVNDFSDISFMNRVFTSEAGPYAVTAATITITEHGFDYTETTEEGYRSADVRWCRDDCDMDERSHRDVFAESMNY